MMRMGIIGIALVAIFFQHVACAQSRIPPQRSFRRATTSKRPAPSFRNEEKHRVLEDTSDVLEAIAERNYGLGARNRTQFDAAIGRESANLKLGERKEFDVWMFSDGLEPYAFAGLRESSRGPAFKAAPPGLRPLAETGDRIKSNRVNVGTICIDSSGSWSGTSCPDLTARMPGSTLPPPNQQAISQIRNAMEARLQVDRQQLAVERVESVLQEKAQRDATAAAEQKLIDEIREGAAKQRRVK